MALARDEDGGGGIGTTVTCTRTGCARARGCVRWYCWCLRLWRSHAMRTVVVVSARLPLVLALVVLVLVVVFDGVVGACACGARTR